MQARSRRSGYSYCNPQDSHACCMFLYQLQELLRLECRPQLVQIPINAAQSVLNTRAAERADTSPRRANLQHRIIPIKFRIALWPDAAETCQRSRWDVDNVSSCNDVSAMIMPSALIAGIIVAQSERDQRRRPVDSWRRATP